MRPLRLNAASAKIGDAHAVEREAGGIELERAAHALHVDARDRRAADIDGERDLARPLERAAVERRAAEGEHAIDVEFGGLRVRHRAAARAPSAPHRRGGPRWSCGRTRTCSRSTANSCAPIGQVAARAQQAGLPLAPYRCGLRARRGTAFGSLASICAGPLKVTPCGADAQRARSGAPARSRARGIRASRCPSRRRRA